MNLEDIAFYLDVAIIILSVPVIYLAVTGKLFD